MIMQQRPNPLTPFLRCVIDRPVTKCWAVIMQLWLSPVPPYLRVVLGLPCHECWAVIIECCLAIMQPISNPVPPVVLVVLGLHLHQMPVSAHAGPFSEAGELTAHQASACWLRCKLYDLPGLMKALLTSSVFWRASHCAHSIVQQHMETWHAKIGCVMVIDKDAGKLWVKTSWEEGGGGGWGVSGACLVELLKYSIMLFRRNSTATVLYR